MSKEVPTNVKYILFTWPCLQCCISFTNESLNHRQKCHFHWESGFSSYLAPEMSGLKGQEDRGSLWMNLKQYLSSFRLWDPCYTQNKHPTCFLHESTDRGCSFSYIRNHAQVSWLWIALEQYYVGIQFSHVCEKNHAYGKTLRLLKICLFYLREQRPLCL